VSAGRELAERALAFLSFPHTHSRARTCPKLLHQLTRCCSHAHTAFRKHWPPLHFQTLCDVHYPWEASQPSVCVLFTRCFNWWTHTGP